MRIGIDARLYGLEHAGLGRYTLELVKNVLKLDKKNHYIVFLNKNNRDKLKPQPNLTLVRTNIPIYSFGEQLIFPIILYKYKLDLLHVPHFNAPLLYFGKTVITIHDLIKHHSKGKETTTRNKYLYFIRRLGYIIQTNIIARKATHIITPTNYVADELIKSFHLPSKKITAIYESANNNIKKVTLSQKQKKETLSKYGLTQPFLVYTGSIYPHKNIDVLITALQKHNEQKEADLMLAVICSRSVFWDRLKQKIDSLGLSSTIKLLGFQEDSEVSKIYSFALSLVHPSKMEGFGLTGIEAMKAELPVISSNATCLPEVYGDAVLYFNPDNANDLVDKIAKLIKDKNLRESLVTKGIAQAKKYSWSRMGKETMRIYDKLLP